MDQQLRILLDVSQRAVSGDHGAKVPPQVAVRMASRRAGIRDLQEVEEI